MTFKEAIERIRKKSNFGFEPECNKLEELLILKNNLEKVIEKGHEELMKDYTNDKD